MAWLDTLEATAPLLVLILNLLIMNIPSILIKLYRAETFAIIDVDMSEAFSVELLSGSIIEVDGAV